MAVYQFKITLNGAKPPVWRRCTVPSGITFSQLAVILNEIMGRPGGKSYGFEFYYLRLRFREAGEAWGFPGSAHDKYDYADAVSSYIRPYIEENDWFTYIYDLEAGQKHRVEVEGALLDYDPPCPQVTKYRGSCPAEDGREIQEYDMEAVNERLEKRCFLRWGKGEWRTGQEIYRDFSSGKYGLKAEKSDYSLEKPDVFFGKGAPPKKRSAASMKEIFSSYPKTELEEIAKARGLRGFSRYSKEKLISLLLEELLNPEEIRGYFLCMSDEETAALERAMKHGGIVGEEDEEELPVLDEACLLGFLRDGQMVVPDEVQKLYRSRRTEEFERERKQVSAVFACLRAANYLYGITPASVLPRLYESATGEQIGIHKLVDLSKQIPPPLRMFVYRDGTFYYEPLYPDNGWLLSVQGDCEFYIPKEEEIYTLSSLGCLPDSEPLLRFIDFLVTELDLGEWDALTFGVNLQSEIAVGCPMQEIAERLAQSGIRCRTKREAARLKTLTMDLWNNTRMIVNRGYTPNELKNLKSPATAQIIDFSTRQPRASKTKKICPNDPCPCGSGKKYKNCCGKNKD